MFVDKHQGLYIRQAKVGWIQSVYVSSHQVQSGVHHSRNDYSNPFVYYFQLGDSYVLYDVIDPSETIAEVSVWSTHLNDITFQTTTTNISA